MEYNIALQSISSDSTQASLDKVESSAVHFIAGAMNQPLRQPATSKPTSSLFALEEMLQSWR